MKIKDETCVRKEKFCKKKGIDYLEKASFVSGKIEPSLSELIWLKKAVEISFKDSQSMWYLKITKKEQIKQFCKYNNVSPRKI